MRNPAPCALVVWTSVLTGCSSVVEQSDIPYDPRYAADVLDTYVPPPASAPRPAVLVVHGGGWTEGIDRSSIAAEAERLAEAGYVTVNIEYRLTPNGGQFPHEVQDCYCALSYMRNHAVELGIDPARIAGFGYSAGGHLVSMLGTDRDAIVQADCAEGPTAPLAAVLSGAGPQDMAAMPQVGVVTSFVGATLDARPDLYQQASPLAHASTDSAPFLVVAGNIDHQSRPMKAALDALGVETRMFEIPGGGHILNRGADGSTWELPLTSIDTPEAQAAMIDFLDHTIGPPP
jgi:acetyl esterase/lipase